MCDEKCDSQADKEKAEQILALLKGLTGRQAYDTLDAVRESLWQRSMESVID